MKKRIMSLVLSMAMVGSMVMGTTSVFAAEKEDTAVEETVELAQPSEDEGYTIGISV